MELNLLQWNANSIRAHGSELRDFISNSNISFDIICIQETYLKTSHNFCLVGYTTIRKDRETAKGGVATLIKETMSFTELKSPDALEAIAIKIKTETSHLTVINLYLKPETEVDEAHLESLFNHSNVIITGDLNAKHPLWGSPARNTRGARLEKLIDKYHLCVLNDGRPTFCRSDGAVSHLDVTFVSNNLSLNSEWEVLENSLGSDHLPTHAVINSKGFYEPQAATRWKFETADWDCFQARCKAAAEIDSITNEDINIFNKNICDTIIEAAEASISVTRGGGRRSKAIPYWNTAIKDAIRNRNRARRRMMATKKLDDCIEYRRLKGIAQRTIKSRARSYWQEYCSSLKRTTNLGSVWRKAKQMNGKQSDKKIRNLVVNGVEIETNTDKANALLSNFVKINSDENYSDGFKIHKINIETDQKYLFEDPPNHSSNNNYLNEKFSIHELRRAIKDAKTKSAPGEDRITYEILKKLPNKILKIILKLYNFIWSQGALPVVWKHSIVQPLLKPGKCPKSPTSYRPISLTSTMCKIMERLVTTRLTYHLEKKQPPQ